MVNKTTNEQKLRLNREIMVHDMLDGGAYINGIRFDDRKQADWVFAVLSNWNSQRIRNGGSDTLRHLIHDADMTYNLKKVFELKGVIAHHRRVANSIIKVLSRIGHVTGEDDIDIIDKMVDMLSEEGLNKITYDDFEENGFYILIKPYVIKSVHPVKRYLEELRSQMSTHVE